MNTTAARTRTGVDEQILKAAATLGVLDGSARGAPRLLALLCDPALSAGQLAAVLACEPGLALRVLRVANSAFYGVSRSVASIDRALLLLGLDAVRGIAAAACLDRTIRRAGAAASLDMDALVHHGCAAAVAAESLARRGHAALAPDAFIAGLLHDLGIAVQLRVDPQGVQAVIEALGACPDRSPPDLEGPRLRVGHEQCAAVLFEAWQLPAALVEAARHHHDPLAAPAAQRELAALVHLGDQLALACGATHALEPLARQPEPAPLALLGMDATDLDQVAAGLPERVRQLREALVVAS